MVRSSPTKMTSKMANPALPKTQQAVFGPSKTKQQSSKTNQPAPAVSKMNQRLLFDD
uniref:Uncharacterized protein n=1 Tax=Aegilops tauschii TaxID=37682 RepID=M8CEM1_AEGTA